MKRLNIQSLSQANASLTPLNYEAFLKHFGVKIRNAEIEDLRKLIEILRDQSHEAEIFSEYYVGYKIPQIGKEFDLLRFGKTSIINIELKRNSSKESIKKQLIRNKCYLAFAGRKICAFTFVSDSKEFFMLNDDEFLERVKPEYISGLLATQKITDLEAPDKLFNPSDYLVSPFNSTDKFISSQYFLTHQQEEAKQQIISLLNSRKSAEFVSVTGGAGTGKTLLTYDIAKDFISKSKKPLIIHCGALNQGHQNLLKLGWNIVAVKNYSVYDFSKYDLLIVDEAQRIYNHQLQDIIEKIRIANSCCIFSHDKVQTLSTWEEKNGISEKIEMIQPLTKYKLSEKIRTNKEIAEFIKMLLNEKRSLPIPNNGNIEINYFDSLADAKNYLNYLDGTDWNVLRFTPSQFDNEYHEKYSDSSNKNSHQVMGQEFDCVAIAIDDFFAYDEKGNMTYEGKTYYDSVKMLFQNITRCRKKLNIVIINNEVILKRCISILQ